MKASTLILSAMMLLPFVLMPLPTASAAATCYATDPSCPGVVCYGYSNGAWQRCVAKNPCDLLIDGCSPCWYTTCYPPM